MSGFLTALNALASGANAGFKTADILKQQKQAQDDRDAADAETKRKLALFQATNQARFKLQNPDPTGPDTVQGEPDLPDIPAGGIGNLPFGSQANAGVGPSMPAPVVKPSAVFDPNVDYGAIGDVLTKNRELTDRENQTKATTEATAEYRKNLTRESDERLAESTRQHNAGVTAAAGITQHAPAARAYLKTQGYDDTGLPDSEAVQEAQRIQHDLIVQRNRPDVPGSFSIFNGTDGQPHLLNVKTGQVTDAPVGKAGAGGAAAAQSNTIIDGALKAIDDVLGDGALNPGILAHGGAGLTQKMPRVLSDRLPGGNDRAQLSAKLGFIRGAMPTLEARGRVSKALLDLMAGAMPDASDPPDKVRLRLQDVKQQMLRVRNPTPEAGAHSPAGEDDFATWVKNH